MTATTSLIDAFFALIESAAGSIEIGWPAVDFQPPNATSAQWLEVQLFNARPIDYSVSHSGSTLDSGQCVVQCIARQGDGIRDITAVAETIIAAFPRGTSIIDDLRVHRQPYSEPPIFGDDRVIVPVVIPYST